MNRAGRQRGSVLVVGLIMLVLLTLMAMSAINGTVASVQVVGNAQFRAEAMGAAQKAIETVISSSSFVTTTPAAQTIDVNGDNSADYTVTFSPAPACVSYRVVGTSDTGVPAICFGSGGPFCYWTVWEISAVVNDATTGAQVTVRQGVRTLAGLNAALASCGI